MLFTNLILQAVIRVTLAKSNTPRILELKNILGKIKNWKILKHFQENT